jgi:hypothetical protein
VLGQLKTHGADVLYTKNSIEANTHTDETAMYYLLLKKKRLSQDFDADDHEALNKTDLEIELNTSAK